MVKRKAINTCEDGTARTIVAWYAKGGRSNFAAWNGTDRFLMTAVLEEYDDEPSERFVVEHQGYPDEERRPELHLVIPTSKDICSSISTVCEFNKRVVEIFE